MSAETVDGWEPGLEVMCLKARVEPEPCDCGFVGIWDHRPVFTFHKEPGHQRTEAQIQRDVERGLPVCRDEGWWVMDGHDERCPGCGDIERFDDECNLIDRIQEHARVVTHVDFSKGRRD